MGGKPSKGTPADKRLKENKKDKREIKPVLKTKSKKVK